MSEKKKNIQALNKKYQQRFTYTRHAREASIQGDFINAIRHYNEYLKIMADIHDVDPFTITPAIFDPKKNISEILLVSQIYWELAKIYDMTPKLQGEFTKALNQFVIFTINQPFQVVNAELLRKHLRKPHIKNSIEFQAAYDKIFIESDKCYISTFCFGSDHEITNSLREFKNGLSKSKSGKIAIAKYYYYSKILIEVSERNIIFEKILKITFVPFLFLISIPFRKSN